jgi:nucleoside 2-deoxyribosyltransferase
MNVYFTAPQNTPYQTNFVQACTDKLQSAGFNIFLASDKFITNQSAFEQKRKGDSNPIHSDETRLGILEKSPYAKEVFLENFQEMVKSDALLALVDGSQVDDRVACEIGIFYGLMRSDASKKGIIGLATDVRCLRRRDSTYGLNIFTLGTLEEVGEVMEDLNSVIRLLSRWNG